MVNCVQYKTPCINPSEVEYERITHSVTNIATTDLNLISIFFENYEYPMLSLLNIFL